RLPVQSVRMFDRQRTLLLKNTFQTTELTSITVCSSRNARSRSPATRRIPSRHMFSFLRAPFVFKVQALTLATPLSPTNLASSYQSYHFSVHPNPATSHGVKGRTI